MKLENHRARSDKDVTEGKNWKPVSSKTDTSVLTKISANKIKQWIYWKRQYFMLGLTQ